MVGRLTRAKGPGLYPCGAKARERAWGKRRRNHRMVGPPHQGQRPWPIPLRGKGP